MATRRAPKTTAPARPSRAAQSEVARQMIVLAQAPKKLAAPRPTKKGKK